MEIRKIAPKKLFLSVLAAAGGSFCTAYADAASDYFDLSLEQLLDTKVLSASKKIESVSDAPAAIYVVTSEDILRSGVSNIPDALRMVPGVNVARLDSNSWAVSIRGFNNPLANKLLVLIDGRTVYNPVFGGTLWEAHNLMLGDIDRIEVVRGPGGSLWGANAVNGVINIITKHTQDTRGNVAAIAYGSEETVLAARHGGSLGQEASYRVYAKAFRNEAFHSPGGGDAYDQWDGVRTGFRIDWGDEFTLQGDAYRTAAQQRITDFSIRPPFQTLKNQDIIYEGVNLLGRWTHLNSDGSQLSLQSYLDWTRRDEPFNFIDNRMTYDIEAQYNIAPTESHEVIVGAGIRYLADNETGNINASFSPEQRRNTLYSAFVQDKITLVPKHWFLTLGSKFEHNEFSGYETQPNLRLQWQPNPIQTLWSSVSRAVRTPTPLEADLTRTLATAENIVAAVVPNDDFASEELTAYEMGYRHQLSNRLSLDLAAFYNDYDRLATASIQPVELVDNGVDPLHVLIPVKFTNDMKGKSRGIEAAVKWSVSENLKLALNFTQMRMSLKAVDPTQESAEQLYPKYQTGLKIFWNINPRWTLDTTAIHVDKLPGGDVDAYTRWDINLGGQIGKHLRFNLIGQNLLKGTHREFGVAEDINASEVERSILSKLVWSW